MLVRRVLEGRVDGGEEGVGECGDQQVGKKMKGSKSNKVLANRKKSLKNGETTDSHKK